MEEFEKLEEILKQGLINQLKVSRVSRTYLGQAKPISGKFPSPFSPPIASGNLIKNIDVNFVTTGDDFALVVEMPDYYFFVDKGRRPGRFPPLSVIDRWTIQKRIPAIRDARGRFVERKTLVYLMARSIALYGTKGTEFIQKTLDKLLPTISQEMGDGAAAYIQNLIDDNKLIVLPQD